jgi:hypothetical protein
MTGWMSVWRLLLGRCLIMTKNIFCLHLSWIVALLCSSGCYSPTAVTNSNEEETPSPSSSSEDLQPTATETTTVIPSPFFTPLPTIAVEEQENYIKEFLETNTDCRLPCWWGVTPGKTSWQETESLLRHLGATIFPFQMESGGNRYAVRLLGLPQLALSFREGKAPGSSVNIIYVGGNISGAQDQREFEAFWENYSPKEVMSKYGVPSRILLYTMGTLGQTDLGIHGYTLWIFYDSLAFMIRYDGFIADEETFRFCFNLNQGANDIDRIELILQRPDYSLPLEHLDSILSTNPSRGIPIQNVTNINVEEFHQLFTQIEKPHCLETPHDIWPTR